MSGSSSSPSQLHAGPDPIWTPRQREVLDLLVRGRTNPEIATALGISLDGAKWHVSEVITKLGVDSREEAAEYWRARNGLRLRFTRMVHALIASTWLKVGAGVAVVAGASAAGALVIIARNGSGTSPGTAVATSILSNGTSGYSYRPQVAYIDDARTVWLANGDGTGRVKLLDDCTGIGSAKRGDVLTGGLIWSPDGSRIACWRDDLSVLAAKADGTERTIPFKPGECEFGPRWAPAGNLLACDKNQFVNVRDPSGTQLASISCMSAGRWSWSPSGTSLLISGPPQNGRGTWNLVDTSGRTLAVIADAYVADRAGFGWTLDGTKLAYPGVNGITVLDVSAGGSVRSVQPPGVPGLDLGSGPQVDWILGDTALLAHNFSGAVQIDPATGSANAITGFAPDSFWSAARIGPDGVRVAFAPPGPATAQRIFFGDLQTHSVTSVPNSDYLLQGVGMSPQFVFSGDSKRVCWTLRPENEPQVVCAGPSGGAAGVSVPIQVEPDVLGRGDPSVLWQGLSPDLSRVAYTVPSLNAATSAQNLQVANLDGSGVTVLGPALGPLTYGWRPDGVYQAPVRN